MSQQTTPYNWTIKYLSDGPEIYVWWQNSEFGPAFYSMDGRLRVDLGMGAIPMTRLPKFAVESAKKMLKDDQELQEQVEHWSVVTPLTIRNWNETRIRIGWKNGTVGDYTLSGNRADMLYPEENLPTKCPEKIRLRVLDMLYTKDLDDTQDDASYRSQ